jgi:predicted metal-dependent phosphoesterase TrpH
MYKINLHAHSTFSDGHHHPVTMARTAKALEFTALVLTDHYYNGEHPEVAMVPEKEEEYSKALEDAREIIPVIRGMEVPYGGEEVLVFGSEVIQEIIKEKGIRSDLHLRDLRCNYNSALILCHPSGRVVDFVDYLDGFERHNSGQDFFCFRGIVDEERLNRLNQLQSWHNSDAHSARMLDLCYNIIDTEITTEEQLIDYIKSGKEHSFEINGMLSEEELNCLLESNGFPKVMLKERGSSNG